MRRSCHLVQLAPLCLILTVLFGRELVARDRTIVVGPDSTWTPRIRKKIRTGLPSSTRTGSTRQESSISSAVVLAVSKEADDRDVRVLRHGETFKLVVDPQAAAGRYSLTVNINTRRWELVHRHWIGADGTQLATRDWRELPPRHTAQSYNVVVALPKLPKVRVAVGETKSIPLSSGIRRLKVFWSRRARASVESRGTNELVVRGKKPGIERFAVHYWIGKTKLRTSVEVRVVGTPPPAEKADDEKPRRRGIERVVPERAGEPPAEEGHSPRERAPEVDSPSSTGR